MARFNSISEDHRFPPDGLACVPSIDELLIALKTRYAANAFDLNCSPGLWLEIERKLRENPKKVEALAKMEALGACPTLVRQERGRVVIAELADPLSSIGGWRIPYKVALNEVSELGDCGLIRETTYAYIVDVLGVVMDVHPKFVWVQSGPSSQGQLEKLGCASFGRTRDGKSIIGSRAQDDCQFGSYRCEVVV